MHRFHKDLQLHTGRFICLLLSLLLSLLLGASVLAGCAQNKSSEIPVSEISYSLYFLNENQDELIDRPYTPEVSSADVDGMILEFIAQMKQTPKENDLRPLLPDGCEILDYSLDGGALTLNMNGTYSSMESYREILTRAGIVRTFLQIDGVDSVQITVDGTSLKNPSGSEVGFMTNNSFAQGAGQTINSYKSVPMTLYFADETGSRLRQENRTVYYSTNEPLERAVIEELIKGPAKSGDYAVFPTTVDVLSVLTQGNVCYVNFDSSINNSVLNLRADLPFYAIVDSLADTCGTHGVQFTIDGENDILYRNTVDLSKTFTKNKDLIESDSENTVSTSEPEIQTQS